MSPFSGIQWISKGDLHSMVRDSIANEGNERQRLRNAVAEFNKRAKNAPTKEKFLIMKKVAEEYGYREEYFISKVNI